MSTRDSQRRFVPGPGLDDQLLDRRGVEEETKSLQEDTSLVAAIGALKEEKDKGGGAVMAPESGKSEFHVIVANEGDAELKAEHVKARRRPGLRHRGVEPILIGGRAHTDPDLGASDEAPSAKLTTQPGIGPARSEPAAAIGLIVPIDTSRQNAEAIATSSQEPVDTEDASSSGGPEPAANDAEPASGRRDKNRRGEALPSFGEARKKFEAELDGPARNKLFLDRETVKREKLEPSSEAYLLLAERCINAGCDLSEDHKQAELDRMAIYARRAARGVLQEALEAADRAPRSRKPLIIVLAAVGVLGLGVACAIYLAGAGPKPATSSLAKEAPPALSVLPQTSPSTANTTSAWPSAAATVSTAATPPTSPTQTAMSTASARPSVSVEATSKSSVAAPGSAKPPTTSTATVPTTSPSGTFSAWKGND